MFESKAQPRIEELESNRSKLGSIVIEAEETIKFPNSNVD